MNIYSELLPCHQKPWMAISNYLKQDRMPHALLLSGPVNIEKRIFAQTVAAALLCEHRKANDLPCGHCLSCVALQNNHYPDYTCIEPEENSKVIKIDQIRGLSQWNAHSAHYEHYKIVLIDPLEALNIAAANSILKILEEPAKKRIFLLVCHQLNSVPATILSRCQVLRFESEPVEDLDPAMLELVLGVIQKTVSPIVAAEALSKLNLQRCLETFESCAMDLQKIILVGSTAILREESVIRALADHVNLHALLQFMEFLYRLKSDFEKKANFNVQLQLEDVLIRWRNNVS